MYLCFIHRPDSLDSVLPATKALYWWHWNIVEIIDGTQSNAMQNNTSVFQSIPKVTKSDYMQIRLSSYSRIRRCRRNGKCKRRCLVEHLWQSEYIVGFCPTCKHYPTRSVVSSRLPSPWSWSLLSRCTSGWGPWGVSSGLSCWRRIHFGPGKKVRNLRVARWCRKPVGSDRCRRRLKVAFPNGRLPWK